jgi:hypothetical protein
VPALRFAKLSRLLPPPHVEAEVAVYKMVGGAAHWACPWRAPSRFVWSESEPVLHGAGIPVHAPRPPKSLLLDSHADRLPALAAELAKMKIDAIVTQGTQATDAARRAATSIPVVFSVAGDPVGTGLVTSLARPGGHVTGLTDIAPEIAGKRLELLREAVPGIARIAVLWNPANPSAAPQMKDTAGMARSLGLSVRSIGARP